MGIATEDTKALMTRMMDQAKEIRSSYKFSEDEKMMPMAFINADDLTLVAMSWNDNKEKYQMAAAIKTMARMQNATSLTFVTDGRAVKRKEFYKHFNIPADIDYPNYHALYHKILREHGGEVKNLPRYLWHDILMVMTNGPEIPLTVQIQSYIEGENDTVKYTETDLIHDRYKSDLLTDWWV
jgi:hypothetical protein